MKITLDQTFQLLERMLCRYNKNGFMNKEQFTNYCEAWFEDLKDQDFEVVESVIKNHVDETMLTAPQTRNKCRQISSKANAAEKVFSPCEFEKLRIEECEISKSMCCKNSDEHRFLIKTDFFEASPICNWHYQVMKTKQFRRGEINQPLYGENNETWSEFMISEQKIRLESNSNDKTIDSRHDYEKGHQNALPLSEVFQKCP